jgi:hypothetical protein
MEQVMGVLKNNRHELFAQALAKGETQVAAYEQAGYIAHDGAAARLCGNVRIMERVAELKALAAEMCLVTVQSLTEELEEARALAVAIASPAAAVAASMGKAKLHGLLVDKVDAKITAQPLPSTVIDDLV